jgi:hypothetical protein
MRRALFNRGRVAAVNLASDQSDDGGWSVNPSRPERSEKEKRGGNQVERTDCVIRRSHLSGSPDGAAAGRGNCRDDRPESRDDSSSPRESQPPRPRTRTGTPSGDARRWCCSSRSRPRNKSASESCRAPATARLLERRGYGRPPRPPKGPPKPRPPQEGERTCDQSSRPCSWRRKYSCPPSIANAQAMTTVVR